MDPILPSTLEPFEQIGSDLLKYKGKQFIICKDRFTGYILVKEIKKKVTTDEICRILENWMLSYGFQNT